MSLNFASVQAQNDSWFNAVPFGDVEEVQALIEEGNDVNSTDEHGMTALMYASYWENIEIAELLISSGANVNATDNEGYTALMLALIGSPRIEIVKLLVGHGADVDAISEDGYSTLDYAEEQEIIKLLEAHSSE